MTVVLSIIVPNYNTEVLLKRCLDSIYRNPPRDPFEVLVVDDASRDGSVKMVRECFPQVRILENEHNIGYARSNNRAFRESSGRFVYLLNSDAEVLPGALDTLVEFLEGRPDVGLAGSLLCAEDGTLQPSVKATPSFLSVFFGRRSFLARWFPKSRFTRSELLLWKVEANEPFPAGYVSSASLMIPRSVLERVGDLDPRFWHFIDADYCRRAWEEGLPVYCVPFSKVIHREHRGGTLAGPRKRFRSVWTFHHGAYLYFRKHSGKAWWHPLNAVVLGGLGFRFVLSLVLQSLKELTGYDRRRYGA